MGRGILKRLNPEDRAKHRFLDIKVVIFLFKMIGLAPFNSVKHHCLESEPNKRTFKLPETVKFMPSRFGFFYQVSLVVVDLLISIICIKRLFSADYPLKTFFTLIIDLTLAIFGAMLMNALWVYSYVRRNRMMELLNRLVKVDCTIRRLSNLPQIGVRRSYVIGVFVGLNITWIVLIVTDTQAFDSMILDWFDEIVPSFVLSHFILQYALMVKLLETRFRNLNRAIANLSSSRTIKTFRSFVVHGEISLMNCDLFPTIGDFRRAHDTLYKIGFDVAEFYSLPILFVISLNCSEIIYNAYFSFVPLTFGVKTDPTCIFVNSLAWVLVLLIPICILTKGVDNLTDEVSMTFIIRQTS